MMPSGGGHRGDGPADGAGGLADQGGRGVMGELVALDLLADHVRALGPQRPAGAAQVVLSWSLPASCSHLWWQASAKAAAGPAPTW